MISTYLKNKMQDYLFLGVAFTPPSNYYIALSKTQPNADGSGVTEPTGGNYARIGISKNTTSFTASIEGVVKNKITLSSPESTAVWGNLPYYAIYDSAIGGNMLWGGALVNPRNMDIEMQLIIDPNGLSFTLGD